MDSKAYIAHLTQSLTKGAISQRCDKPQIQIAFICLGNICRSPLAEGIAHALQEKHLKENPASLLQGLQCSSAGTSGLHSGESIDDRSIAIAAKHGINIAHYKSKQISLYAHGDMDLLLAMDKQNLATLRAMGFDSHKVMLLGEFGLHGAEVPDPYYGGASGFENVYTMLHTAISELFTQLEG